MDTPLAEVRSQPGADPSSRNASVTGFGTSPAQPGAPPPGVLAAFEAATRVLTGVALRSTDMLSGAVSLPQFRMLAVLADLGTVRSSRVARALGSEPSTVTRLADRLVASGYVSRAADPVNRSVVLLELTGRGHDLVARVAQWRRAELTRILAGLPPADQAVAGDVLGRFVAAAGEGYGTFPAGPVPL